MKKLWRAVKKYGVIILGAIAGFTGIAFIIEYFKAPKNTNSKNVVKQKIDNYKNEKNEIDTKVNQVNKKHTKTIRDKKERDQKAKKYFPDL